MYQEYWGLSQPPFRNPVTPGGFFESPTHEEALARLDFLVENRRRLAILSGPAGCGKSTVLDVFARRRRRQGSQAAIVNLLGLGCDEFLWALSTQLRIGAAPTDPVPVLWQMLVDRLIENRYQRIETVFLLDDADRACGDVLTHAERLAHVDASSEARLTLVFVASDDPYGHLPERLTQLCELRIDLEPWDVADTQEFLHFSLSGAGRESPVFDPLAVARLHELSLGIPRRVRQLAELSLLAGASKQLGAVDGPTVESVYEELGVSSPAAY